MKNMSYLGKETNETNKKFKNYIAVDLDGTLYEQTCIGKRYNYNLVKYLNKKHSEGSCIIVYTCRSKTHLDQVNFIDDICEKVGLKYDYINYSPKGKDIPSSQKLWYDVLFDDRCGDVWGNLNNLINYFENNILSKIEYTEDNIEELSKGCGR